MEKKLAVLFILLTAISGMASASIFSPDYNIEADYQHTDTITEKVNVTEYETVNTTTSNGTVIQERVESGWHYEQGESLYYFDVENFETDVNKNPLLDSAEVTATGVLKPNDLTKLLHQADKTCTKDNKGQRRKCEKLVEDYNSQYYYEGEKINRTQLTDLAQEAKDIPFSKQKGNIKSRTSPKMEFSGNQPLMSNNGRFTFSTTLNPETETQIKLGSHSTVFTVSSQADWNQGTFNGTTSDRSDNSGILGIGYPNGTSSDNIEGFWRFDTTSGSVLDYSGNGFDGTHSGPTRGVKGLWSTNAFSWDGDDDRVNFGDQSAFEFSSGESFTFVFWQKQNPDSTNGALITKGYDNTGSTGCNDVQPWYLSRTGRDGGEAEFFLRDSNGNDFRAAGSTDITGSWTQTVAVYDAGDAELRLYINGDLVDTVTGVNEDSYGTNSCDLVSGSHATNFGSFDLDNLQIYRNDLSQSQITELYRWGTPYTGDYTGELINESGKQTWEKIEVDSPTETTNTELDAVFQSINSTGSVIDEQIIPISQGTSNYSLSVQDSEDARVNFNGTSSEITESWEVNSYDVFYQKAIDYNLTFRLNQSPLEVSKTGRMYVNASTDQGSIEQVNLTLNDANGNLEVDDQPMTNDTQITERWYYDFKPDEDPSSIGTWDASADAKDSAGNIVENSTTFDVIDDISPKWRNLTDNSTEGVIPRDTTANISAEWQDNETGFYKAILSTNETGSFVNSSSASIDSPQTFDNSTQVWNTSYFGWKDNSFDGLLGYKIWGQDSAGNWNVTDTGTFEVNDPPQVDDPIVKPNPGSTKDGFTVKANISDINDNLDRAEINLTNAYNNLVVENAVMSKVENIVDDFEDGDVAEWTGIPEPSDFSATSKDVISGSFSGKLNATNESFTVKSPEWTATTSNLSYIIKPKSNGIGETSTKESQFRVYSSTDQKLGQIELAYDSSYSPGDQSAVYWDDGSNVYTVLSSYSGGQEIDLTFDWDFSNQSVEIYESGTLQGEFPLENTASDTKYLKIYQEATPSIETAITRIDDISAGTTGEFEYYHNPSNDNSSIGEWDANITAYDLSGATDSNSTTFNVIDDVPPLWRNLQDSSDGSIFPGSEVTISAEFQDNQTGLDYSKLSTNETGVFQNHTVQKFLTKQIVQNVSAQSDWNQGTFDLTSADRNDNSGDLGLGYLNNSINGLEAYWRLDRESGNVIDYTGNGHDGTTISGPVTRGERGIWDTPAFNFGDGAAYIDADTLPISNSITAAAWVNPQATSSNQFFLNNYGGQGDDQHWLLCTGCGEATDNQPAFFIDDGNTGETVFWDQDLPLGEWSFVAGTYDDSTKEFRIYVDGDLKATADYTGNTPNFQQRNTRIGGDRSDDTSDGNHYRGLIDDPMVIDSHLTTSGIQDLYRQGKPFRGSYTAETINRSTVQVWGTLSVDAEVPSDTALTAEFRSLYNNGSIRDKEFIDISDGSNNYTINVEDSEVAQIKFNGTSTNETQSWVVNDYSVETSASTDDLSSWIETSFDWQNESLSNTTVGYKIWGNDTQDNWNVTDTGSFRIGKVAERNASVKGEGGLNFDRDSTYNRDAGLLTEVTQFFERTVDYTRDASVRTQNNLSFDRDKVTLRDASVAAINTLAFDRDLTYTRNPVVKATNNLVFDRTYSLNRNFQLLNLGTLTADRTKVSRREANVSTQSDLRFDRDLTYTRNPFVTTFNTLVFDRTYNLTRDAQVKSQNKLVFDAIKRFPRSFSVQTLVDLAFDEQRKYEREGTVNTEVDLGFDRDFNLSRSLEVVGQGNFNFNRDKVTLRDAAVQVQNTVNFDRTVDYSRSLFVRVWNTLTFNAESEPNIRNVEVEIDSLGNGRDVILNVNVTDDDGLDTRRTIEYDGDTYNIDDGEEGQVIEFNISDSMDRNGTIVITDNSGLKDRFNLAFEFTDNDYSGTGDNLSLQTISKSDTYTLQESRDPVDYDISHEVFDGSVQTGGNFTGTTSPVTTVNLDTEATGDFLEETRTWKQRDDKLSTVEKQYIEEQLSIKNLPDVPWNDITVEAGEAPEGFGPGCDSCSSKDISFTGNYFNSSFNQDTGDAVLNQFDKKIDDVVIGERETYFEQYRYVSQTDVPLDEVQATAYINDSEYDFGSFVQVARNERTFDTGTFRISSTNTCTDNVPEFSQAEIYNKTWNACSEDENGNAIPEFFKIQIRDLNTTTFIRYGGFLGTAPEDAVTPFVGLKPCSPEGAEFKTQDGSTLVCYDPNPDGEASDNQWRLERNIERQQVDRSVRVIQLGEALGFSIMLLSLIAIIGYRNIYGEYPPRIRKTLNWIDRRIPDIR